MEAVDDNKQCEMAAREIAKHDMEDCFKHHDSIEKCVADCNTNMKGGSTQMCKEAADWTAAVMSAEGDLKECLSGGVKNIMGCMDECLGNDNEDKKKNKED